MDSVLALIPNIIEFPLFIGGNLSGHWSGRIRVSWGHINRSASGSGYVADRESLCAEPSGPRRFVRDLLLLMPRQKDTETEDGDNHAETACDQKGDTARGDSRSSVVGRGFPRVQVAVSGIGSDCDIVRCQLCGGRSEGGVGIVRVGLGDDGGT